MVEHGTRSMYITGCRCSGCKLAESEYQRGRRRRGIKPGKTLASVPVLPVTANSEQSKVPVQPPGPVEAGVLAELEGLTAAARRPGLVQGALAMARLLDSPLNVPQHAPAMARLQAALDELRRGADSRKGWLADVRRMTPASGAAG